MGHDEDHEGEARDERDCLTYPYRRAKEGVASTSAPQLVSNSPSASSGCGEREVGGMTSQAGGGNHGLENMVGFDLRKGASREDTNK